MNVKKSKTCTKGYTFLWRLRASAFLMLFFLSISFGSSAQENQELKYKKTNFFEASDTFSPARFYSIGSVGLLTYSASSYGLYHSWYKKYPLGKFHLFNDRGEWEYMDKVGHSYTSWMQGYLVFSMAKWSGLNDDKSLLTGIIAGSLFQSTIEVMDGFSEQWGFSLADMGANLIGTGMFAAQQHYFGEQKLLFKFSSFPKNYSDDYLLPLSGEARSSLRERARDLYGSNLANRTLKDYNAQNYWLSFGMNDLFRSDIFPKWLNLSIGYSPENIYGGHSNSWTKDGSKFDLNESDFKRYHQFFIAPDVDFTKINTSSPFAKSLFRILNILKCPSPALEFNDLGGVRVIWHWVYY